MGGEIAQVISFSGLPVVMKDVDQAMLDKGMETIRHIYQSRVDKGKMSAGEMEGKIALIEPTLGSDGFANVDIVIEAVPEKMKVKRLVLGELDAVLPRPRSSPATLRRSRSARWPRQQSGPEGDRDALLQPGSYHEAGGDHPRAGDGAGDD